MPSTTDVAIIGGGAIGSAVAYFLLSDPAWKGRVTVVERDPSYKRASSALSASSIRQQFSTPENIRMSRFGFGFLAEVGRHLAVDGEAPDIGLRTRGYLYLGTDGHAAVLRENHAIQSREGAAIALLSPHELAARFPWMSVEGVALGALGLADEGWFDGYGLMQAFRRKARSLGAVYVADEAVGLERAGARIAAVKLASGASLACGTVVNAAGPWARAVAAMAGVPLPVEARRRCIFVFDARRTLPDCPLLIDTSGVFFRPEGEFFICGTSPPEDEDLHELPLEVDHRLFDEVLWPALAARVPAFEALRVRSAWAGYYEMNGFDHNGIAGLLAPWRNAWTACGFSGHGMQQAPAVGAALAARIAGSTSDAPSIDDLDPARIAAGRPLLERNVI